MSNAKVIQLKLSLKGRPLRTFTFDQDLITIGRDPDSDVFLDNPGISRKHVTIMRTPGGYYALQDMKSSNGTFMNGKRVQREYLTATDEIRVGKYTLGVDYAEDRRVAAGAEDDPIPTPGHTTMLSREELNRLIEQQQREREPKTDAQEGAPDLKLVESAPPSPSPGSWWASPHTWTALVAGTVFGLILSRWF